jgi:hypothetical protein
MQGPWSPSSHNVGGPALPPVTTSSGVPYVQQREDYELSRKSSSILEQSYLPFTSRCCYSLSAASADIACLLLACFPALRSRGTGETFRVRAVSEDPRKVEAFPSPRWGLIGEHLIFFAFHGVVKCTTCLRRAEGLGCLVPSTNHCAST